MKTNWDLCLEQASGDPWWMPQRIIKVRQPSVHYCYDPDGDPRFSVVQRVDPSLQDYAPLVDEVLEAHRPSGESAFPLGKMSHSTRLTDVLLSRGFSQIDVADAWTIDVKSNRPVVPDVEVRRVKTLQEMRDQEHVMISCFERYIPRSEELLIRDLEMTIDPQARCYRFVAYDRVNGEPLATSNMNLYPQLSLGFMWGGSTLPEARGRGVYSALVTKRMRIADQLGLTRIGLYALRGTSGPIIERQGFERHGPCEFWENDSLN